MTEAVDRALAAVGLPAFERRDLPTSTGRFPDGAAFRIEIPSTEGPDGLEAVIEEADRLDVPVRRVSQGSGVGMLTDAELDRMATLASDAGIEVSLFVRPGAAWGPSAAARSAAGGAVASATWGHDQLRAGVDEMLRAAEHGFRSVLLADLGLLSVFGRLKEAGTLPAEMQAKVSVMFPTANAATARVLEDLGAGTVNVPGDLDVAQIATIRSVVSLPLDVYVESPEELGGFVRLHEAAELIRVAAPIHVKLGLRNAPVLYPSGAHLYAIAIATVRERVRRARLMMESLERAGADTTTSAPNAAGLAVPLGRTKRPPK